MIDPVVHALSNPNCLNQLDAAQWDLLIRQARRSDLLGRISENVFRMQLENRLPKGVRAHLEAERVLLSAQHASVLREVAFIEQALAPLATPVILLKGAAYLLAGLPAASGRSFSDIDILLPRPHLPAAESALMLAGWMSTHLNNYDQRYYRNWMHELPPLQHLRRQTVLDVHHAIMPLTARLRPDSELLMESAQPLPGSKMLHTLCPPDMVLHSMTHLLHNEEFSHGLRDLSDLDLLLRHFGHDDSFWKALLDRAERLTLRRPLFYGLRYAQGILGTPVPQWVSKQVSGDGPPVALQPLMDSLWLRALRSTHPQAADMLTPTAHFLLYLRSHWLKMPLHLLVPHLLHKAWRAVGEKPPATPTPDQA